VTTTDILSSLPAGIEWTVVFRLSTIQRWLADTEMKEMFRFPQCTDFSAASHVVLSSVGRFLASSEQTALLLLSAGQLRPAPLPESTLLDRHRSLFEVFDANSADCLGFAANASGPPVLLHLEVKETHGEARAIFHREPSRRNYELLSAAGIEYIGGRSVSAGFLASFHHRMPIHLHAAHLASYERAGNCNRFFFNHGEIDTKIEAGLLEAARQRIIGAKATALNQALGLAHAAAKGELAMTCQPPPPREPFAYGDLVPLGFLLNALDPCRAGWHPAERVALVPCEQSSHSTHDASPARQLREKLAAAKQLRQKLTGAKQGDFWAFHTSRLVTATDSVLILQGLRDRHSIEALEHFSDGHDAYFPQLWGRAREPGRMAISTANAHWCQPDFATTCMVMALRAEAGLPALTPLSYIHGNFATRSGLFFANPYLVDWTLACAIASNEDAHPLNVRLRQEILAGMNPDYSFGRYDLGLSTSFAILALAALGCRHRLLCLAQTRLAEMIESPNRCLPESIPFYSTRRLSVQQQEDCAAQVIARDGGSYGLWLYRDTHHTISTAAALMALDEASDPMQWDMDLRRGDIHERYRCQTQAEYIAGFALPPYLGRDAAARLEEAQLGRPRESGAAS
jgi:hypothetical protein